MTPHRLKLLKKWVRESLSNYRTARTAWWILQQSSTNIIDLEDALGAALNARYEWKIATHRLTAAPPAILGSAMSPGAWARHEAQHAYNRRNAAPTQEKK